MKTVKFFFCLLIVCISAISNAQHNGILIPAEFSGKWGYVDVYGKVVIQPQFHSAEGFSDSGLAAVESGGKYGFIDRTGKVVVGCQYERVTEFYGNYASVKIKGKFGVIDKNGKVILEPKYEFAFPSVSSNGYIPVVIDNKLGFIDKTGAIVVEPQYDKLGNIMDGIARVRKDSKWGFVDQNGKVVIGIVYDYAQDFSEDGLAVVAIGDKAGYIDKSGRLVIKPTFYQYGCGDFRYGVASVSLEPGKHALMNKSGVVFTEAIWESIGNFSKDGIASARQDGLYGYIDITGEPILGCNWDAVIDFLDNGLGAFNIMGSWSFIDRNTKSYLDQYDFTKIKIYKGIAFVKNGDEIGLIDPERNYVPIPGCTDVIDSWQSWR